LERLEGMAAPMECTFAQRADDLAAAHDSLTVALPEVGEDLFSLAACVPLELLLHNMAQDRGVEAGVFERISKVTRRE